MESRSVKMKLHRAIPSRTGGGLIVEVIVKVSPEVGRSLQGHQSPTAGSEEILRTARELGVDLRPIHPGATDPYLAPFFYTEVADRATADRVIARFKQCQGAEAAYWKPEGALP
jgi:hypothetical protein